MGKIIVFAAIGFGVVASAVWYLLLRRFLGKNEGKNVGEVEPTVKKFMATYTAITLLTLAAAIAGAVMNYMGI